MVGGLVGRNNTLAWLEARVVEIAVAVAAKGKLVKTVCLVQLGIYGLAR